MVDDDPSSRHEAMSFACQLLGVDPATLPEQPPADALSRSAFCCIVVSEVFQGPA